MQTVRVYWALPTLRESGKAFNPADADHVLIQLSADNGVNWGDFGTFIPPTLTCDVPDLEPGTWFFRGQCVDKAGLRGKFAVASVTLIDTTAPGLITLTLTPL